MSLCVYLLLSILSPASGKATAPGSGYALTCRTLAHHCRFKFEGRGAVPKYSIRGPRGQVFSQRVVSKKPTRHLGLVDGSKMGVRSDSHVQIFTGDQIVPVTDWDVDPPFHPSPFRAVRLPYTNGSALVHDGFSSTQRRVLVGRCIRVFFQRFEVLKEDGSVRRVVSRVPQKRLACVVFKVSWG